MKDKNKEPVSQHCDFCTPLPHLAWLLENKSFSQAVFLFCFFFIFYWEHSEGSFTLENPLSVCTSHIAFKKHWMWSAAGVNIFPMKPQMQVASEVRLSVPDRIVPQYHAIWCSAFLKSSTCTNFFAWFQPSEMIGLTVAPHWVTQESHSNTNRVPEWTGPGNCKCISHPVQNMTPSHVYPLTTHPVDFFFFYLVKQSYNNIII